MSECDYTGEDGNDNNDDQRAVRLVIMNQVECKVRKDGQCKDRKGDQGEMQKRKGLWLRCYIRFMHYSHTDDWAAI